MHAESRRAEVGTKTAYEGRTIKNHMRRDNKGCIPYHFETWTELEQGEGTNYTYYVVKNPNKDPVKIHFNPTAGGEHVYEFIPCNSLKTTLKGENKRYQSGISNYEEPGRGIHYKTPEHRTAFDLDAGEMFCAKLHMQDLKPYDKERNPDCSIKYPDWDWRTYYAPGGHGLTAKTECKESSEAPATGLKTFIMKDSKGNDVTVTNQIDGKWFGKYQRQGPDKGNGGVLEIRSDGTGIDTFMPTPSRTGVIKQRPVEHFRWGVMVKDGKILEEVKEDSRGTLVAHLIIIYWEEADETQVLSMKDRRATRKLNISMWWAKSY